MAWVRSYAYINAMFADHVLYPVIYLESSSITVKLTLEHLSRVYESLAQVPVPLSQSTTAISEARLLPETNIVLAPSRPQTPVIDRTVNARSATSDPETDDVQREAYFISVETTQETLSFPINESPLPVSDETPANTTANIPIVTTAPEAETEQAQPDTHPIPTEATQETPGLSVIESPPLPPSDDWVLFELEGTSFVPH
jgi:hypothetical protein